MFAAHRARLVDLSLTHRLPTMYGISEHAKEGGLMAYSVNFTDVFRRADYVALEAAKAPGLTIPQSLLLRADEVIQ